MIKNYIKTAIRNALREWPYSTINILGLALGVAVFLFIWKYTSLESDIDNFHENKDRIYKIYSDFKWNSMESRFPQSSPGVGTSLAKEMPGIELVTRVRQGYGSETRVQIDDSFFNEEDVYKVDSNFLKIFSFELVKGNPDELFKDPGDVVLSESLATKYFGNADAIGNILEINGNTMNVVGIIEDAPKDSHIRYSMLLPLIIDKEVEFFEWSWVWSNLDSYVLLEENTNVASIQEKLPELVQKNAAYTIQRITGNSVEEFFANGNRLAYYLVPLSELYYDTNSNMGPSGQRIYLTTFRIIAIVILLLACINYTNLATSRAVKRSREIGIRKSVGSTRKDIISQFVIEAFLFSLLATVLAVLIGSFINNILTEPFGIRWDLSPISSWSGLLAIPMLSLIVTLVCGLYPSLYLSSFQPATVLKGQDQSGRGRGILRNSLVVFQFVISFGIIIMAFAAQSQLNFLKERNMGFTRDQLLVVQNTDLLQSREVFKNQVNELGEVQSSTYTNFIPGIGGNFELFKKLEAWDEDFVMFLLDTDEDFFKTYGVGIEEGDAFTEADINKASKRVVVNRQAISTFGFENPIGQKIMALDRRGELTISGIMNYVDFFLGRRELTEMVIRPLNDSISHTIPAFLTVRVNTSGLDATIDHLGNIWDRQGTGSAFEYIFFDQVFDKEYRSENRMSDMMNSFTMLAIFIALLGMVGLISYNSEQSRKMIGIRKVFGATVPQVILLLTRDFMKLLFIAYVIAIPVANYLITDWLSEFAYRVELGIRLFLVPGLIIFVLALITSWVQTFRAASANPVDVIRKE